MPWVLLILEKKIVHKIRIESCAYHFVNFRVGKARMVGGLFEAFEKALIR